MSILTRGLCVLLAGVAFAGCDKGPAKTEAAATTASKPADPAAAALPDPAATPATPAVPAAAAQSFGAGIKLAEVTPIDKILAEPKAFEGKTVRVEGMITDVCPKRGCWMELAGTQPGQKLRFKVTDGEMVFPMDAKGQRAVAEGVVAVKELTLEQTKQHAEYQAKEYGKAYDPASITTPTTIVRIDGTGAEIHADKI